MSYDHVSKINRRLQKSLNKRLTNSPVKGSPAEYGRPAVKENLDDSLTHDVQPANQTPAVNNEVLIDIEGYDNQNTEGHELEKAEHDIDNSGEIRYDLVNTEVSDPVNTEQNVETGTLKTIEELAAYVETERDECKETYGPVHQPRVFKLGLESLDRIQEDIVYSDSSLSETIIATLRSPVKIHVPKDAFKRRAGLL